ncbi:hypothetical protein [Thermodesulfovibrio sp. TK110]
MKSLINKEKIIELYNVSLLYEIHRVQEKIRLFENKYNIRFEDFEKLIKSQNEENFESWDDYMEWKAYEKKLQELKKENLDAGNYQLS